MAKTAKLLKSKISKDLGKSKISQSKEKSTCKYPHKNLWCVSILATAIIVLTWIPSFTETWSRVVVTILAAMIFTKSIMVNCCK